MALRPDSWIEIAEGGDDDAATALSVLLALAAPKEATADWLDEEFDDDPEHSIEELFAQATDMIPYCV